MAASLFLPIRRNTISSLPAAVSKYHEPCLLTKGIGISDSPFNLNASKLALRRKATLCPTPAICVRIGNLPCFQEKRDGRFRKRNSSCSFHARDLTITSRS
jgi:hypothetical protein